MSAGLHIAFRLDASVAIGSGHLMRCLALADALRGQGASVAFIMRCDIGALREEVAARGHVCRLLPEAQGGADDWQADAVQTLACLNGLPRPDCLIVDHYRLDARWENLLRPATGRLMVIDDLADRPHDCDILLDQNFNPDLAQRYDRLVPAHCRQLLGPQFAMLRPEFSVERARSRVRDGVVRRLAVFFGGTDPGGDTVRVLAAIEAFQQTSPQRAQPGCDIIIGSANPQREVIEQLCRRNPHLQFHCQISNMAQVMAAADLCIGAGGTALWERAVLGVPSLVTAIADNQVSASAAMAQAGALLYMGRSVQLGADAWKQALGFALGNPWLLISLSRRSLELVDGNGLARVAACVSGSQEGV